MAHFAQVNSNNIVTNVLKVPDSQEHRGEAYLNEIGFHGKWIQTSFNTVAGEHVLGEAPLRGNYAVIGGVYDSERDVFYKKQPKPYMILNTETFLWEYPVPYPTDVPVGSIGIWNESIMNWDIVSMDTMAPVIDKDPVVDQPTQVSNN